MILPDKVDVSPALRDIPPIEPAKADEILLRLNEMSLHPGVGSFDGVDVGLQSLNARLGRSRPCRPPASTSWGQQRHGVLPPDTQGDVGPNHYVQWVNLAYSIYDKSGNKLSGPTNGNTLWSGFDRICANNNDGDPITIYDHLADRWMMSQFQVNSSGSSYQCIAVSQRAIRPARGTATSTRGPTADEPLSSLWAVARRILYDRQPVRLFATRGAGPVWRLLSGRDAHRGDGADGLLQSG